MSEWTPKPGDVVAVKGRIGGVPWDAAQWDEGAGQVLCDACSLAAETWRESERLAATEEAEAAIVAAELRSAQ